MAIELAGLNVGKFPAFQEPSLRAWAKPQHLIGYSHDIECQLLEEKQLQDINYPIQLEPNTIEID